MLRAEKILVEVGRYPTLYRLHTGTLARRFADRSGRQDDLLTKLLCTIHCTTLCSRTDGQYFKRSTDPRLGRVHRRSTHERKVDPNSGADTGASIVMS
jgi:hypothetical protein